MELGPSGVVLAAKMYDPSTLVNVSLSTSILAMTAFDTTNLRLTFVAPPSGRVRVKMSTFASKSASATPVPLFLGVLDGSTVRLRCAAFQADQQNPQLAFIDGIVTGLTAGTSYTWDAAYGNEETSPGALRYGGPNNTTLNDAAGGFLYEISEA